MKWILQLPPYALMPKFLVPSQTKLVDQSTQVGCQEPVHTAAPVKDSSPLQLSLTEKKSSSSELAVEHAP
jgi:hypothetical protein